MKLIYTDESGNTGTKKDPNQPLHLIAAVIVDAASVRDIEDGVALITSKHVSSKIFEPDFELHASDLFRGTGFFKDISPAVRIAMVEEIFALLATNGVRIGWTATDKMKMFAAKHPHQVAFVLLVERLEEYLRSMGELGLIVADENKEIEQRLIDDLALYKRTHTNFGYKGVPVRHIIDSVHFVQSQNNALIQCADLAAYFILRGKRTEETTFQRYIDERTPIPWENWKRKNLSIKEQNFERIYKLLWPLMQFAKVFP